MTLNSRLILYTAPLCYRYFRDIILTIIPDLSPSYTAMCRGCLFEDTVSVVKMEEQFSASFRI